MSDQARTILGWILRLIVAGILTMGAIPKFTGGWIFTAPAVGDLDGDGRLDVVAVTREGYLFAWEVGPRRDAEVAVEQAP